METYDPEVTETSSKTRSFYNYTDKVSVKAHSDATILLID